MDPLTVRKSNTFGNFQNLKLSQLKTKVYHSTKIFQAKKKNKRRRKESDNRNKVHQ